ncbi:MAG: hypothetical protein K2W95_17825 [Candidatus Obscuribacterales bacterium]|nr:hypothetical protein [Candidatus Obscuribacterales bacterium]
MLHQSYQQAITKVTGIFALLGCFAFLSGCAPFGADNSFAGRQWERGMLDGRYFARLHQTKKARRCFSDALSFASVPGLPQFKRVATLAALAELAYNDENFQDSQRLYSQAVDEIDAVLKRVPLQAVDRSLYLEDLGRCLTGKGRCLLQLHKNEQGLEVLRNAVATFYALGPGKHSYEQVDAVSALIDALMLNRSWGEASKYCDAALSGRTEDGYTPLLIESLQQKRVTILQATGKHKESVSEQNLPEWRASMSAALRLLKEEKQFEAAAAEYRRAIALASEMQPKELPLSLAYMGVADCDAWLKKIPDGFECLNKALALREAAHADDDETTDRLLKRIINFSFQLNRPDSEIWLKKQLKLREKLYGENNEHVGETLALTARFYIQQKKLNQAKIDALRAFSLMKESKSTGRATASADSELAETLRLCGALEQAEYMYVKAFKTLSRIPATAGSRRAVLIMRAASIARFDRRETAAARYEQLAEQEYQQGVTIDRERIRTAMVLATYADQVLAANGERAEALQLLAKVKELCTKSDPADAEETAWKNAALNTVQKYL